MKYTNTKLYYILSKLIDCSLLESSVSNKFLNKELADKSIIEVDDDHVFMTVYDNIEKNMFKININYGKKKGLNNYVETVMKQYDPEKYIESEKDECGRKVTLGDFDSINTVAWYNGLSEYVHNWRIELEKCIENDINNQYSYCWYRDRDKEPNPQLEVLWIIACNQYGNWGTSPRTGWIESDHYNTFREWCDAVSCGDPEEDYLLIEKGMDISKLEIKNLYEVTI